MEGKGLSGLEAWVGFGQRTGNSESQPGEKEKEESVSPSVVSTLCDLMDRSPPGSSVHGIS